MKYTIKGLVYVLEHVEMGIYQIITPTGNKVRFANKDLALAHIKFLKG